MEQIRRLNFQSRSRPLVAEEQETALVRYAEQLMRVDCHRICEVTAQEKVLRRRRENGRSAPRGINVQPQSVFSTDRRHARDVIERAKHRSTRCSACKERNMTVDASFSYLCSKSFDRHLAVVVASDFDD